MKKNKIQNKIKEGWAAYWFGQTPTVYWLQCRHVYSLPVLPRCSDLSTHIGLVTGWVATAQVTVPLPVKAFLEMYHNGVVFFLPFVFTVRGKEKPPTLTGKESSSICLGFWGSCGTALKDCQIYSVSSFAEWAGCQPKLKQYLRSSLYSQLGQLARI